MFTHDFGAIVKGGRFEVGDASDAFRVKFQVPSLGNGRRQISSAQAIGRKIEILA